MNRARSRRAILLVFVGAIFSGFAFVPSLREPVRDALREVVGFRRVEQYSSEIEAAAREQGLEPALLAAVPAATGAFFRFRVYALIVKLAELRGKLLKLGKDSSFSISSICYCCVIAN